MTKTKEVAPRSLDEIYDDLASAAARADAAWNALQDAEKEDSEARLAIGDLRLELKERNDVDIRARMNGS